jgi:hypothetical protein
MLVSLPNFRRFVTYLSPVVFAALSCPSTADGFCNVSSDLQIRHEYQFLAGYSPKSSTLVGTTRDRRFFQAGFAYSYRCWTLGAFGISPTATMLPMAMVFQPDYPVTDGQIPAHSVYGLSVLPLGLTFDLKPRATFGVFGETHGGIIASAEPVPIDTADATGLNFIFDFGVGARWRFRDAHALRFGYRFVHISNAGTTAFNPGVDNNVLYASFSILR